MGIIIKIGTSLLGLLFLLIVIYFVRKGSLRPSYVILWIIISLFLLSLPLVENVYIYLSYNILGFQNATHVIYIILIGFLFVYSFYLTIKFNKISDQVQILISYTAILEKENQQKYLK